MGMRVRAIVIGLVALLTFASCSSAQPGGPAGSAVTTGSDPVRGGAITIGVRAEAAGLDPQKAANNTTRMYARALYNTLTNVDLKGTVIPELAESWTPVDARTWEFKIRKGVKFHDGTDL